MRNLAHLALLICLLASDSVHATQDEAARLYEETRQLYERWEASDDTAEALGNLELARARLDVIVQRHPGSAAASQLVLGDPLQRRLDIALAKHRERAEALRPDSRDDWDGCLATLSSECLFDLALAAARDVDFEHPLARTFGRIGSAQAKAGQLDAATHSFELAKDAARTLPDQVATIVLADVAELQAQGGMFDAAQTTLEEIRGHGFADLLKVDYAIVEGLALNSQVEQAIRYAEEIVPTAESLLKGIIFKSIARNGRFDLAIELIDAQDPAWRDGNLRNAAVGFASAGEVAKATELAHQIQRDMPRAVALAEIAEVLGKTKQFDKGIIALHDAMSAHARVYASLGRPHPNIQVNIAQSQAWLQNFNAARATIETIEYPALLPDANKAMIQSLAVAGKIEQAFEYMLDRDLFSSSSDVPLAWIVDALVADRQLNEALSATQRSESIGIRSYSLRQVAAAWARAGETDLALQMAREITDAQWRAAALGEIALAVSQQ